MRLRHILPSLLVLAAARAEAQAIIPPSNLFKDPSFVRSFVGSYGFLSEVEPKVSSDEQTTLNKIRELFEKSQYKAAEQELANFIRSVEAPQDPEQPAGEISPAMVFVLGNLYFQADRPDEARRAFLEAIRRFPRFRRAHTNLGYLYISQNKTGDALPMLQKAIELGENSARTYGLLGYCHLTNKDAVAAESAYRQACLLDPASRDWKLGLSQSLMMQEKNAEAATLIGSLIEANPNDKQLWLQQTNAYLAMERKEDAIVNLESMRVKGIADEANLNLLGNLYMDSAQPQLALLSYLAAMEKSQILDVDRTLKSARILNDYGYPEKAAALISRIRSKAGAQAPLATRSAILLADARVAGSLGENDRRGLLLAELIEINPANGEVLLESARFKDGLAREEADETRRASLVNEAMTNYQLATRLDDVAYQANLGLGQMLVREQRYSEALTHLEAALGLKKSESLEQYVSRVRRAADRAADRKKNS